MIRRLKIKSSRSKEEIQFLTQFIVESDAIESIRADRRLVSKQLKRGHTDGHVGALLLLDALAKKKQALTHRIIRRVQGLITSEQHTKLGGEKLRLEWVGIYRPVWVQIGGRMCPSPEKVLTFMEVWLSQVSKWQDDGSDSMKEKLAQIATFHFDYEFIHPFADGNGRSGRAIVYYLMRYSGLNPFVFTAEDRSLVYYPAFRSRGDMQWYFETKARD